MRLRALLATAVVAALAPIVLLAGPASAHDVLVSSDPAADASVSGDLDRVTLTLSEPPISGLQTGIVISVTDAGGAEHTSGAVRVDGTTIAKDADLTTAGTYRVRWRSVSVDGHPISGEYGFTSTGATAPSPTTTAAPTAPASPATAPTARATEDTEEVTATVAAPVGHQHHTPLVVLLLVALAVVVFSAVVGIRALRDRRAGVAADGPDVDGPDVDGGVDERGTDR